LNDLRFDHKAEEMTALIDQSILRGTKMVDDLVMLSDKERTYDNTILPIAEFESDFSSLSSNMVFYRYVSTLKE
jgi:hypothetical protein